MLPHPDMNDHKRRGKILLVCLPRSNVSSSLTVLSINLNSFTYTSHGSDKESSIETANSKPKSGFTATAGEGWGTP